MSWLEKHIEEFVKPNLDRFDREKGYEPSELNRTPLGYFTSEEHTVIKNAWRATKKNAAGKEILLAGRDVFIFEVLARRENYPTLFMPECSRMTASSLKDKIPNIQDYFLFDTGFVGSIPKALGIEDFTLLSFSRPPMSWDNWGEEKAREYENRNAKKQVFPRMSFSRRLALKIEGTPKYWESARVVNEYGEDKPGTNFSMVVTGEKIVQPFSSRMEFENAARLTIEIYTNSSPKFVKKHQPINIGRGWI